MGPSRVYQGLFRPYWEPTTPLAQTSLVDSPECPGTHKDSGPKSHPLMAFGTRDLKYWVLGPSGQESGRVGKTALTGYPTV